MWGLFSETPAGQRLPCPLVCAPFPRPLRPLLSRGRRVLLLLVLLQPRLPAWAQALQEQPRARAEPPLNLQSPLCENEHRTASPALPRAPLWGSKSQRHVSLKRLFCKSETLSGSSPALQCCRWIISIFFSRCPTGSMFPCFFPPEGTYPFQSFLMQSSPEDTTGEKLTPYL